ncbi:MAG: hypothetical protein HY231_09145 [Acidobacteria bacterium]|nr:hypothetical protein [Acidobacteriota bacterium]
MSGNAPAPEPVPDADRASTPTGTIAGTASSLVNVDTSKIDQVGVFTTTQSLITFPGAVAAVTTIWKVLGAVYEPLGKTNKLVPVALSLAIGILIYLSSVTHDASWKKRLSGFGVAVVNSFTIAAAALGIS